MKIEERIADLEELIKTKEFLVNDAKWTLEHVPEEIEVLKSKLKELSQAGKAGKKSVGNDLVSNLETESRRSISVMGDKPPAPDSETTYQKAGEAGKLGSLHALSPQSSVVKKNGPPAPLEDE